MLRSKFFNLTILSSFLHIAFFWLVSPVFYNTDREASIYSWGSYDEANLLALKTSIPSYSKTTNLSLQDFLLPAQRPSGVDFKKSHEVTIVIKKRPEVKLIARQKQVRYTSFIYTPQSALDVDIEPVSMKHKITLKKHLAEKEIEVRVLISPAGRVIWVEDFDFLDDVSLRFNLDDWLRSLNFPASKDYNWKSIQIMLK